MCIQYISECHSCLFMYATRCYKYTCSSHVSGAVATDVVRLDETWTPSLLPLPSDTPKLCQHVLLPPMARAHANTLSTLDPAKLPGSSNITDGIVHTVCNRTRYNNVTLSIMPPIIRLPSNTPNLHQHVFSSPTGTGSRKRTFPLFSAQLHNVTHFRDPHLCFRRFALHTLATSAFVFDSFTLRRPNLSPRRARVHRAREKVCILPYV